MLMRAGRIAVLCAGLLLVASMAWAQLPTASVRGLVLDSQGGALPGVTVTITDTQTGITRRTVTNDIGVYRLPGLPGSTYQVHVELSGFQRQERSIPLQINQEAELNFTLGIAGAQEEVQVTAVTPMIETTRSEVARTFSSEQIRELPLAGRNYLNLAFLAPGVTGGGTGLAQGMGASVNGQRARNVNFMIDGSDNNDASVTNPRTPLMQDAVGEFRLVTSLFSAEYGRNSGAIAVATTKSGSNIFHGTAYEFFEDAKLLNARTSLDKSAGLEEPPELRRDTYGFTLGGPVLKGKTFFFGGFQNRPFSGAPSQVPISSPTAAGRALLATIPTVDPQMLELLNRHVPVGNAGTPSTSTVAGVAIPMQQYIASVPSAEKNWQLITRVDHNLSQSDLLYGRYIYATQETEGASNPPGFANDTIFPTHNFVSTWNRVLSSALLNELHFSFGRTGGLFPGAAANPAGNNDLPTLAVTSIFTVGLGNTIPQDRVEKVYQLTDAVSWLRGNHSFKFGGDVRYVDLVPSVPFDFRGTYTFNTFEQFMTNRPFSLTQAYGNPSLPLKYWETNVFIQDDWKATPHLTLNVGLRYERVGAAEGFYSNVSTDNNNFAPRLGFAWDLSETGTTVLKGGAGITYDQFFLNLPVLTGQSPPYQRRITDLNGEFRYPNVPADRPLTPAEELTLGRLDIPDDARSPYGMQWQLGVQRQIGSTWRADVSYIGSRALKQIRQRTVNPVICCPQQTITDATGRPSRLRYGNPLQTGQISALETSASSAYHSGQFSLERRFNAGLSITSSYTWSKYMDDATESLGTGLPSIQRPQDNFDLRSEWSLSSLDRPHRFVMSFVYELPFFREQTGLVGRTLGGWQFAGNYTAQSGQPFSIITGVDSNGDGDAANDRPNAPTGDRTRPESYAARPAASGGNGTLGRNTERGPGVNAWNAVFSKNIRMFASHELQFRIEVFNLLNHRQFSLLANGRDRNLTVPSQFYNFGTSNGGLREPNGPTTNARSMILGLKYQF